MADRPVNRLNIATRGELADISKPRSSNQSRACSNTSSLQASSATTSASRLRSSVAASLQLLTPEEVMEQDYDLALESIDYSGSESDDASDTARTEATDNINTGRTSSIFGTCVAEPRMPAKQRNDEQLGLAGGEDDEDDDDDFYLASRQLTIFGSVTDDSDCEVSSEEERDICQQIKEEISAQMKDEMRGELALVRAHRQRQDAENQDRNADLADLDPELRQAIIKMRKLDRILVKKMKKEKQVKRDRIILQRKVRAELAELQEKSHGPEPSETKRNTDKFLALELPPSHNTGVKLDDLGEEAESPPVTPLFQTQLPDDGVRSRANSQNGGEAPSDAGAASSAQSNRSGGSAAPSGGRSSSSQRQQARKNKDFIRRNKELAADAQNTIAMTDDEKQRLEGLLQDIDTLPDIPEDDASEMSSVNPYQITLSSGEGFMPTEQEMKRLEAIDTRLMALLPSEDYESIASSPHPYSSQQDGVARAWTYETEPDEESSFFITLAPVTSDPMTSDPECPSPDGQSVLFTRTTLHPSDVDQLGEQALKDTKEHRDLQHRLKDIEQELSCLSSAVEMELHSPQLSGNQLDYLLDQCARTMSRATAETDSLACSTARSAASTSRQSLFENPPHLPADVLQQLLADARQSMGDGPPSTSAGQGLGQTSSHNWDGAQLESVNEETLQELLDNPRTTSRQSSRPPYTQQSSTVSCTQSQSDLGSSRLSQYDMASSRSGQMDPGFVNHHHHSESSLPREPFLPEIDPTGTMSTQRLNNDRLNNESRAYSRPSTGRSSAVTVRNALSENFGVGGGTESPHPPPPSSGRRSNSGGKHRTVSPFTHNLLD